MNVIRQSARLSPFVYTTTKSFYVCARYGRKAEAKEIANVLLEMGHTVTSTWVDQVEDEMLYGEGVDAAGRFAQKDIDEVRAADVLLYLSEDQDNPWGRGGRHVEFGCALAFGKMTAIIGPLENLFHYLPGVLQFVNQDDFFRYLKEEAV